MGGTVRGSTHSRTELPMPWIWSDELAHTLVRAGLADQKQVSGLILRPRAIADDELELLEALAAFGDEDESDKRRVA